tara:strand:- start:59 stop:337 length:279 start_codon:yes stop_codon:yes gene_type:complete
MTTVGAVFSITVPRAFTDKNISRGGSPSWDDKEFYDGAPDGLLTEEKNQEISRGIKRLLHSVYNVTDLEIEIRMKRYYMMWGDPPFHLLSLE